MAEVAYREKIDRRIARERTADAAPKLIEALRQIAGGHNDPRALARQALDDMESRP